MFPSTVKNKPHLFNIVPEARGSERKRDKKPTQFEQQKKKEYCSYLQLTQLAK